MARITLFSAQSPTHVALFALPIVVALAVPGLAMAGSCAGDVDGDGEVSGTDLAALLSAWGSSNPAADFNASGTVDAEDLTVLLGAWGTCAPSAPIETPLSCVSAASAPFAFHFDSFNVGGPAFAAVDPIRFPDLVGQVADVYLVENRTAAQWAANLGTADKSVDLLRNVAQGWAQNSPGEAAAWVATLPPGAAQNSAALSIVGSWSQQEPAAAAAWVGAFPEGQTRDNAVSSLLSGWTQNDPLSASKWLEALPAGRTREKAAESFLDHTSYQEPALAAKWATELFTTAATRPDQPNRNTYRLENIARNWLNLDERAAREWIQKSPLPEEKKSQLLERKR